MLSVFRSICLFVCMTAFFFKERQIKRQGKNMSRQFVSLIIAAFAHTVRKKQYRFW